MASSGPDVTGQLTINFGADTTQLNRQVSSSTKEVNKLGDAASQASNQVGKLGTSLGQRVGESVSSGVKAAKNAVSSFASGAKKEFSDLGSTIKQMYSNWKSSSSSTTTSISSNMSTSAAAANSLVSRIKDIGVALQGQTGKAERFNAVFIQSQQTAVEYMSRMQQSLATNIAMLYRFIQYFQQAANVMEKMDVLQASYSRVMGVQIGPENLAKANDQMMRDAINIAHEYGASIEEVASTMVSFAKQGRSAQEIQILAHSLGELRLLLATTTGQFMSMSEAMQAARVLMNQLDISATDAVKAMRLMAEYDVRAATSFEDLNTAIGRFAAAAKVAGMSTDEVIKVATAFTEIGIGGARAGTALNTIIARTNQDQALAFFQKMGVASNVLEDGVYRTASAFERLQMAYQKVLDTGDPSLLREFGQVFAGTRMQSVLQAGIARLNKQTRASVDQNTLDSLSKSVRATLEQSLSKLSVDAQVAVNVQGKVKQFSDQEVRVTLQRTLDTLTDRMSKQLARTGSIAIPDINAALRQAFGGITSVDLEKLSESFEPFFKNFREQVQELVREVQSPYDAIAQIAENGSDEYQRAMETMQNTIAMAKARAKTEFESVFLEANVADIFKASVEEVGHMARDMAVLLTNTIGLPIKLLNALGVSTGAQVKGIFTLVETWLVFKTMGAIKSMTQGIASSFGSLVAQSGVWADKLRHVLDPNVFLDQAPGNYEKYISPLTKMAKGINSALSKTAVSANQVYEGLRPAEIVLSNVNKQAVRASANFKDMYDGLKNIFTRNGSDPSAATTFSQQSFAALTRTMRDQLLKSQQAVAAGLTGKNAEIKFRFDTSALTKELEGVKSNIGVYQNLIRALNSQINSPGISQGTREQLQGVVTSFQDAISTGTSYVDLLGKIASQGGMATNEQAQQLALLSKQWRNTAKEAQQAENVQVSALRSVGGAIASVVQSFVQWVGLITAVYNAVQLLVLAYDSLSAAEARRAANASALDHTQDMLELEAKATDELTQRVEKHKDAMQKLLEVQRDSYHALSTNTSARAVGTSLIQQMSANPDFQTQAGANKAWDALAQGYANYQAEYYRRAVAAAQSGRDLFSDEPIKDFLEYAKEQLSILPDRLAEFNKALASLVAAAGLSTQPAMTQSLQTMQQLVLDEADLRARITASAESLKRLNAESGHALRALMAGLQQDLREQNVGGARAAANARYAKQVREQLVGNGTSAMPGLISERTTPELMKAIKERMKGSKWDGARLTDILDTRELLDLIRSSILDTDSVGNFVEAIKPGAEKAAQELADALDKTTERTTRNWFGKFQNEGTSSATRAAATEFKRSAGQLQQQQGLEEKLKDALDKLPDVFVDTARAQRIEDLNAQIEADKKIQQEVDEKLASIKTQIDEKLAEGDKAGAAALAEKYDKMASDELKRQAAVLADLVSQYYDALSETLGPTMDEVSRVLVDGTQTVQEMFDDLAADLRKEGKASDEQIAEGQKIISTALQTMAANFLKNSSELDRILKMEHGEARNKALAEFNASMVRQQNEMLQLIGTLKDALGSAADGIIEVLTAQAKSHIEFATKNPEAFVSTGKTMEEGGKPKSGKKSGTDTENFALAVDVAKTDYEAKLKERDEKHAKEMAALRKQLRKKGRSSRGNPEKDAFQQIMSEYQQGMSAIEIAYKTIKDAEGNIVDFLDRTGTQEHMQAQIDHIETYIKKLREAAQKLKSGKELQQAQAQIEKLALQKVNIQWNMKVQLAQTDIKKAQQQIDLLNKDMSEFSNASFEERNRLLDEIYQKTSAIYDKRLAVTKESEKENVLIEKRNKLLDIERQKVSALWAEYSRQAANRNRESPYEEYDRKWKQENEMIFKDFAAPAIQTVDRAAQQLGDVFKEGMDTITSEAKEVMNTLGEARRDILAKAKAEGWNDQELTSALNSNIAESGKALQSSINNIISTFEKRLGEVPAVDTSRMSAFMDVPLLGKSYAATLEGRMEFIKDAQKTITEMSDTLMDEIKSAVEGAGYDWSDWSAKNAGTLEEMKQKMREYGEKWMTENTQNLDAMRKAMYDKINEALTSGWDEGFDIGLEYGFSKDGWEALSKSIKTNIAKSVNSLLKNALIPRLTQGIQWGFEQAFQKTGLEKAWSKESKALKGLSFEKFFGTSLSGFLAPIFSSIVGELIGFLIGGTFNEWIDAMEEAQEEQQRDSINAQGFTWSYQDPETATPYYEFAPPVTQESVKVIKFNTTFNITTDSALALASHRRELDRVITELFDNWTRTAAKTVGATV